ncbi:NHLP leader peptide family RiPP precursor [Deltaproteobacteria bacterium TL4]
MNYDAIIQKTWEDATFKTSLMTSPKATLAKMGHAIPEGVTVSVYDDSTDKIHFVLLEQSQASEIGLDTSSIIGQVTKRAYENSEYKSLLLSDAQSAVKELTGVEVPQNIVVHENTSSHINLVLPVNPEITGELSDSDLVMVAGGKGLNINCSGISGLVTKVGDFTLKVGDFFGENAIGNLFNALGPLMTGGGTMLGKVSNLFNKDGATA